MSTADTRITDVAWRGVEACRRGALNEGLRLLRAAAEAEERSEPLPGLAYSYLGYAVALLEDQKREGVRLCRHAIKLEFYQPEHYFNLARTYLLMHNRRAAVRALRRGLGVDPADRRLIRLAQDIGVRRRPVLPFLSRANPINQLLGRLRHALRRPRDPGPPPPP